jgi:hypothetical protein
MKITLDQLRSFGACNEQVALFERLFGSGVELTEALVLEHGSQFDLNWLARKLFRGDIRAEYQKSHELISAEYWKACALIWAKYWKDLEPIEAEYRKACALAFWACVLKMEEAK